MTMSIDKTRKYSLALKIDDVFRFELSPYIFLRTHACNAISADSYRPGNGILVIHCIESTVHIKIIGSLRHIVYKQECKKGSSYR